MKARIFSLIIVVCGVCVMAAAADPYQRAERLAAERRFEEAETEYRRQLEGRPADWRLRLGLARVLLWSERYSEAERAFAPLVAQRPQDADALLGFAQTAYWSGDFRTARVRYQRLLAARPQHEEARKALADLALLSAPTYEVTALHRSDSQPYDVSMGKAVVSWSTDPLTRWDVRTRLGGVSGAAHTLAAAGGGISAVIPRLKTTVGVWAERFRYPDGAAEIIGEVSLSRQLPWRSEVVAAVERIPLLATASSVARHVSATQYRFSWRRMPTERWLAAASVHGLSYSDENEGLGADAWGLAPLFTRGSVSIRGGLSAAWRDTDENRFRFTSFASRQLTPGQWQYTFSGVYDPYWTPHALREGRVVVVAETARVKLHLDGGVARDEYVGFGPTTGPTPGPSIVFPAMLDRSFHPWRASAEVSWPLVPGMELRARYGHDVSAFYRANEIEASLVGRF